MKPYCRLIALLAAGLIPFTGCQAQEFGKQVLKPEKQVPLPSVKGRIDHIDIDIKDQVVYIAALANNTLEVVDLKSGKVTGHIDGLDEPQGVAYIPEHQEILVTNGGTGECSFYNAATLKKIAGIKLSNDADDVRYDAVADKLYVGYGSGGIAIIDAAAHKQVGDIHLPSHPESFQLDAGANKLWVNLPGSGMVGVADLRQLKLTAKWSRVFPRSNFPMAYDAAQHRIIAGYRLPAKMVIYSSETGKEIFSAPITGDADDLYWDPAGKQILISGGGGNIDVFKQTGDAIYKQTAHIKTRSGARTSLFVPQLNLFLIAARAGGDQKAALLIYSVQR